MRIGILIRDEDYRDALVEKLSTYDNDLFVNVIDSSEKDTPDSLILTDIPPEELDGNVLKAISQRTVFLTRGDPDVSGNDCHRVFKYCSTASIVSEMSMVYSDWHGGSVRNCSSRIMAVLTENDSYSAEKCRELSRQIIYSHGGKVLILPLSYINDHGTDEKYAANMLSRLLYSIRTGRERGMDGFTYTDSYGVSSLLLPKGINPVSYLDEEELRSLVTGLSRRFDVLILDIGTCFRSENMTLVKEAGSVMLFETGRRVIDLTDVPGFEMPADMIRIRLSEGADEAMAVEDAVRRIYGKAWNEDIKGSDGKEIRN